jgi:hypothetical protein
MPIPAQHEQTITFNAVYSPAIVINQSLVEGRLRTGVTWVGAPISVDADGVYSSPGQPVTEIIPDIEALPADLSALQAQALQAFSLLASLLHQINAIRKAV